VGYATACRADMAAVHFTEVKLKPMCVKNKMYFAQLSKIAQSCLDDNDVTDGKTATTLI